MVRASLRGQSYQPRIKNDKKPVDGSKKMVWGLDELKMFGNGLLLDEKAYRAKWRFLDAKQRLQNM